MDGWQLVINFTATVCLTGWNVAGSSVTSRPTMIIGWTPASRMTSVY